MVDLMQRLKGRVAQPGMHLAYPARTETRREQVLNKARKILTHAVFRSILLCSKPISVSDKPAIVFAPHQDDETFGCGGLIALKREKGTRVKVVILTDGAAAAKASKAASREQIIQTRNEEVLAATATLGVEAEDVEFFLYPDGGLGLLSDIDHDQAVERIATLLKEFQPGEVYVTHRHDMHTDHEAAYQMVTEAILRSRVTADVLQYPIWLVWLSGLGRRLRWRDLAGAVVLPIHSVSDKKREAIGAFRSQLGALPSGSVDRFYSQQELFFATKISAHKEPAS